MNVMNETAGFLLNNKVSSGVTIKRRLLMLTISKQSRFSYMRRLMILPLLSVLVCHFALHLKNKIMLNLQNQLLAKDFKLVAAAGHGGKDMGAFGNDLY